MSKAAAHGDRSELLSAYLDGELPPEEEARVESLLEREPTVRAELDGMRRVVGHLRHAERVAPPQTLDLAVARRIALAGEQRSLLDRIEDGMAGLGGGKQSHMLSMFALVIALAAIILFFSYGLHKMENGLIPVIFGDPEIEDADLSRARQVLAGHSLFERIEAADGDDLWLQDGLDPDAPARVVPLHSDEGRRMIEEFPELRAVAMLGHVKLRHQGEVIELITHDVLPPVDGLDEPDEGGDGTGPEAAPPADPAP